MLNFLNNILGHLPVLRELVMAFRKPYQQGEDRVLFADMKFVERVAKLNAARQILLEDGIQINGGTPPGSEYNSVAWHFSGASTTRDDWKQLEQTEAQIFGNLKDQLLQKFRARRAGTTLSVYTLYFGLGTLITLLAPLVTRLLAMMDDTGLLASDTSLKSGAPGIWYCFWLILFGGLGSCASLAVNALLIQNDIAFDFGEKRMINLRILTGCLFSFVIALTISSSAYNQMIHSLADFTGAAPALTGTNTEGTATEGNTLPGGPLKDFQIANLATLLLPFLVGFSTSLVLTILNRLLSAVQTLFGPLR